MYRTIKGIVRLIKKEDPDTAITESYIRRLIKDRVLICEKNGSKNILEYYHTMDTLNSLFNKNKAQKSSNIIMNHNIYSLNNIERAKARIKAC